MRRLAGWTPRRGSLAKALVASGAEITVDAELALDVSLVAPGESAATRGVQEECTQRERDAWACLPPNVQRLSLTLGGATLPARLCKASSRAEFCSAADFHERSTRGGSSRPSCCADSARETRPYAATRAAFRAQQLGLATPSEGKLCSPRRPVIEDVSLGASEAHVGVEGRRHANSVHQVLWVLHARRPCRAQTKTPGAGV